MINLIAVFTLLAMLFTPLSSSSTTWAETIPFFDQKIRGQFLAPVSEYGRGHRGIDLEIALNETIKAPENGILNFEDEVVDRPVITLLTESGKKASFEPACSDLPINSTVKKGEVLGYHCEPRSTYNYHCQSCVHVSARSTFGYLSPLYLMKKEKPSILKL